MVEVRRRGVYSVTELCALLSRTREFFFLVREAFVFTRTLLARLKYTRYIFLVGKSLRRAFFSVTLVEVRAGC